MDTERISYAEVLNDAQVLMTSSNEMKDIFDNTERIMNTLGNSWESEAASQFAAKFNQLKAKFPLFYEAVQNYSKFLSSTVETYQAADQAIKNSADSNLGA